MYLFGMYAECAWFRKKEVECTKNEGNELGCKHITIAMGNTFRKMLRSRKVYRHTHKQELASSIHIMCYAFHHLCWYWNSGAKLLARHKSKVNAIWFERFNGVMLHVSAPSEEDRAHHPETFQVAQYTKHTQKNSSTIYLASRQKRKNNNPWVMQFLYQTLTLRQSSITITITYDYRKCEWYLRKRRISHLCINFVFRHPSPSFAPLSLYFGSTLFYPNRRWCTAQHKCQSVEQAGKQVCL